jgi:hypothetical protein
MIRLLVLVVLVVLVGCSKDAEEYIRKSKRTEAELQLNKILKGAKVAAITNDKFPVGTTGPVPATDCCKGPEAKCPVDRAQWETSPWQELDFAIDEPHRFRYTYTSDGKTFTATAIGDLDCDTTTITYKVSGTYEDGAALTTPVERPTNTD